MFFSSMEEAELDSRMSSIVPKVEFYDVSDQYSPSTDLICKYTCMDYRPQEGDRIAIYKLGWFYIKDYVLFEWVFTSKGQAQVIVVFDARFLPQNINEIYQFCYISGENEVYGASTPFQFGGMGKRVHVLPSLDLDQDTPVRTLESDIQLCHFTEDVEIKRLREENEMLRKTVRALCEERQNNIVATYDKGMLELKEVTQHLKNMLNTHQKDIDVLKGKIRESGEEYKKLYIEKVKIEKKYKKLSSKQRGDPARVIKSGDFFEIGELQSLPPFPLPEHE